LGIYNHHDNLEDGTQERNLDKRTENKLL
jgi:hypothetical protein